MAEINVSGSCLGNSLQAFIGRADILPGDVPSYEACKTVLLYHPLGAKMTEAPVKMAQSKPREIAVPGGPEDRLIKAFNEEWKRLQASKHIRNTMKLARTYGIASVVYGARGIPTNTPIKPMDFHKLDMYFNVLDPLNTAGSLVLNQDPNAPDFQKKEGIAVGGQVYHPSRSCVILNEEPVYIAYTTSAYGFVGRSVYQRAWFPLKSFVSTMVTDDMIARKAGLIIAKMKPAGSITDRLMLAAAGYKRNLLKEGETNNVLSISPDEEISSIDLNNIDDAGKFARDNILKNIATASDMPAALLDQETFARGMAEGTEDAKTIAQYIDGLREDMQPLYDFFDRICMYRAWGPDFYSALQSDFPEYRKMSHENALYGWINSFHAEWPSFLDEPPSEQVKTEEIKHKSMLDLLRVVIPVIDQSNRALAIQWAQDNLNANKVMFTSPLGLDIDAIADYEPPEPIKESKDGYL